MEVGNEENLNIKQYAGTHKLTHCLSVSKVMEFFHFNETCWKGVGQVRTTFSYGADLNHGADKYIFTFRSPLPSRPQLHINIPQYKNRI